MTRFCQQLGSVAMIVDLDFYKCYETLLTMTVSVVNQWWLKFSQKFLLSFHFHEPSNSVLLGSIIAGKEQNNQQFELKMVTVIFHGKLKKQVLIMRPNSVMCQSLMYHDWEVPVHGNQPDSLEGPSGYSAEEYRRKVFLIKKINISTDEVFEPKD